MYLVTIAATAIIVALIAAGAAYLRERALSRRLGALLKLTGGLPGQTAGEALLSNTNEKIGILERALAAVASEVRDVVKRLETEVAHREAILSSMREGVLTVDGNLRVIFCNDAMLDAAGVQRPIRDRLPLIELIRDSEVLAIAGEVVRSGTEIERSLNIAAASGRSFEIYAAPFQGTTGRGAIAIFYDITDVERLEHVRKDFVANVSHEMRTPLANIIASCDTLLEGALEDSSANRRFIEMMRSNADRLNRISADLLTLSDLESGVNPGQPERVWVHEVLESALRTVEPEATNGGINIVSEPVPRDLSVTGYRFRLEQALLNLLTNAVKFNRPAGEVRISTALMDDANVRISISDTGIGIPSQDLPRIFERFYRVDKARSREVGGTGLGLSIVKHAIEGMGGNIKVESMLGRGSTFTIHLPAAM